MSGRRNALFGGPLLAFLTCMVAAIAFDAGARERLLVEDDADVDVRGAETRRSRDGDRRIDAERDADRDARVRVEVGDRDRDAEYDDEMNDDDRRELRRRV